MSDDLSSSIRSLVLEPTAISGLLSVTIIDHYGVPFFEERSLGALNQNASRFTSIGGHDQKPAIKRLQQGENKYSIAFCKNHQLIQINKYPLTVIFLATETANTGLILKKAEELDEALSKAQQNANSVLGDGDHGSH
jgi:hypothetical protein